MRSPTGLSGGGVRLQGGPGLLSSSAQGKFRWVPLSSAPEPHLPLDPEAAALGSLGTAEGGDRRAETPKRHIQSNTNGPERWPGGI